MSKFGNRGARVAAGKAQAAKKKLEEAAKPKKKNSKKAK